MSPAEADECEIWQLASLLNASDASEGPDTSFEQRVANEQESLKARLAAAGKGVRRVEEKPDGPVDVTADIMRSMGIVTK